MNDDQLLRYSRQIMLPDVDIHGQQALLNARVLIVGLGGLGSPVALYLAAAGVGELALADGDSVDLSNLQRQIAHTELDLGSNKAQSAADSIAAINSDTTVNLIQQRLDTHQLHNCIDQADLVIDATDNAATRMAINAACWRYRKPLVSGAAIRWEGQVAVFDPTINTSPCYRCLYPELAGDEELSCSENGVISPLVGIIGTHQALEAVKYITGVGSNPVGTVAYFDGKYSQWHRLKLSKMANCPVCAD